MRADLRLKCHVHFQVLDAVLDEHDQIYVEGTSEFKDSPMHPPAFGFRPSPAWVRGLLIEAIPSMDGMRLSFTGLRSDFAYLSGVFLTQRFGLRDGCGTGGPNDDSSCPTGCGM